MMIDGQKSVVTRRPGLTMILSELRRELRARGIRVGQLAQETGVSEPTVWRWLRGEGLTLERLDRLCEIADIDLRDLLGREEDPASESFTLAQERVLAADRGLALVFFAILHGAQRGELVRTFGLSAGRIDRHVQRLVRLGLVRAGARGKLVPGVRRSVRWRRGGPLAVAFDRTVKPLFLSMDFGAAQANYVSDMVPLSTAGQDRVQAMFETLRDDIHLIAEGERVQGAIQREWCGLLMMVRPFDMAETTAEWRQAGTADNGYETRG
jgi:Predicted transcriptional regulator